MASGEENSLGRETAADVATAGSEPPPGAIAIDDREIDAIGPSRSGGEKPNAQVLRELDEHRRQARKANKDVQEILEGLLKDSSGAIDRLNREVVSLRQDIEGRDREITRLQSKIGEHREQRAAIEATRSVFLKTKILSALVGAVLLFVQPVFSSETMLNAYPIIGSFHEVSIGGVLMCLILAAVSEWKSIQAWPKPPDHAESN